MPTSNTGNKVPEELLKSLEATTMLMQNLLGDIKEHSTSLTLLKAKLEALSDSVEVLSNVVRDGNGKGSMVTRLALLEKTAEDLEDGFDELKIEMSKEIGELKNYIEKQKDDEKGKEEAEAEHKRQQMMVKLKILAVAAPGILALAVVLIKLYLGME